ncbi:MAG TPA: hypothetical protein K8V94_00615 [Corynebacterium amycolatum]|nr:hypothetical protein [Corynebacterium amycolatum]
MDRSDPEATVLFGGGDDVIDVAPVADVFPFPDSPRGFAGEQDETKESAPNVQDGGYDPTRHVAYNGEDEDVLRREQEGDWEDPDHPIP